MGERRPGVGRLSGAARDDRPAGRAGRHHPRRARYQYGRTDRQRLISFSISKTVTAMLIGIAVEERAIRSVDNLASAYVPELVGTEYGRTSIRHLLQMSSGVRFSEDYGGADDFTRLREGTFRLNG